jgi:hypothetical protein
MLEAQKSVQKKVMPLLLTGLKIFVSEIQICHNFFHLHDAIPGFQVTALRRKSSFPQMESNGVIRSQGHLSCQPEIGCPKGAANGGKNES